MKHFARIIVIVLTIVTLALGVTLGAPARSDYQAGVEAYQRKDFKTALAEWLPLAEAGDATAQNSVGALYDHGLGVDEDDATAAYWYQRAAEQNLPLAMRNLANMYVSGHGVPFDKALADSWYQKAASLGDPVAIKRLATLTPSGEFAAATAEQSTAAGGAEPVAPSAPPAAEPMSVAGSEAVAEAAPEPEAAAPSVPTPEAGPEASSEAVFEAAPAPEQPPEAPAAAAEAPQYGDNGDAAAAAAPAVTQQAAMTPPPAPAESGNWLIGMWEGPSLGCPPGGGLEFAPAETRSYFGGQIAARLAASYKIAGDRITVTTTGVDGVGHSYEYERSGPDTFVIAAVPPEMPSSMIGVEHRRCAGAPFAAAAAPEKPAEAQPAATSATAPAAAPAQPQAEAAAPKAEPFVPQAPAAAAQPAPEAVPVEPVVEAPQPAPIGGAQQEAAAPKNPAPASAQAGWEAFGRGDYAGALAIWRPLAESGDASIQLLVGSIYDYGQGVPQDDAEAAKWYERAALQGSAKGQYQTGAVYARSPQIKDPVQAYKWLTIAARTLKDGPKDGITADQALTLRTLVEGEMSEAEIAQAKQEAEAFKATKG